MYYFEVFLAAAIWSFVFVGAGWILRDHLRGRASRRRAQQARRAGLTRWYHDALREGRVAEADSARKALRSLAPGYGSWSQFA
jgi:hypothetical protein